MLPRSAHVALPACKSGSYLGNLELVTGDYDSTKRFRTLHLPMFAARPTDGLNILHSFALDIVRGDAPSSDGGSSLPLPSTVFQR